MVPNVNGDVSVGERDEHFVIQVSEITKRRRGSLEYTDREEEVRIEMEAAIGITFQFFCDNKSDNLHDAMHAAAVLYLHLVLLDPNVVVAIIHVDAAVLGTQPHRGLIRILLRDSIVDTRYVAAQRHAARVRAWNVVRVRVVGARATAKCASEINIKQTQR